MAGSPSKQGLGTPGSSAITQAFAAHGHALVEHAVPAPQCQALAAMASQDEVASHTLSGGTRNCWARAAHQDLSVPVAQQVAAPGWQGWSAKEGHWFVQPPATWLAHMVAVRLHLDDCGPSDGPLRVLPGTHTQGRLSPTSMATLRQQGTETVCTAPAGAALLMRPLLVHASSKSTGTSRRRVLHFVFGPTALPHGLRWHTTA